VSCPAAEELLEWLDGAPVDQAHVDRCARCAGALEGMRRVRALARAVGGPARSVGARRGPRGRAAPRLARALSTVAAAALFAVLGAEPALRRRIDRAVDAGEPPPIVHAGSAVFWTSGAVAARVGR
jgi:hypothetical protein